MMRIKEAIQRRRLIQQLNDEYAAIEDDSNLNAKNSASTLLGPGGGSALPGGHNTLAYILRKKNCLQRDLTDDDGYGIYGPGGEPGDLSDHHRAYLRLHEFVSELNQHLSDAQRRALRVTWKRLSEPPKTSGRGTLQIMEKCIEERRTGCPSGTIATIRDHAHLLIDLIDGIMCVMFDTPFNKPVWDPATIGRAHAKYIPMGFEPNVWQKMGEHFAEIMFSQECVRAYPHAASAWSTLSVVITDKMYSQTRRAKNADFVLSRSICSTTSFTNAKQQKLVRKASLTSLALLPSGSSGIPGIGNAPATLGPPVLTAKCAAPVRPPITASAISPSKKHILQRQKSFGLPASGRKKLPPLLKHDRASSNSLDVLPARKFVAHRKIGIFNEGSNSVPLSDEGTTKARKTTHRQITPPSALSISMESCHENKSRLSKGVPPPLSAERKFATTPLRRAKFARAQSVQPSTQRCEMATNKVGASTCHSEIRSRCADSERKMPRQKSFSGYQLPSSSIDSPLREVGEKANADDALRNRGRVGAVMHQAHFSSSGESTDV